MYKRIDDHDKIGICRSIPSTGTRLPACLGSLCRIRYLICTTANTSRTTSAKGCMLLTRMSIQEAMQLSAKAGDNPPSDRAVHCSSRRTVNNGNWNTHPFFNYPATARATDEKIAIQASKQKLCSECIPKGTPLSTSPAQCNAADQQ